MSENRKLLMVCAIAFVALLLVAIVFGVIVAIESAVQQNSFRGLVSSAMDAFLPTMIIGTLPAIFYGAPAYVLLLRKKWARWYWVLVVGVLPGILGLPLDKLIAPYGIVCGGVVALLTHYAWLRVSSNKALQPTRFARG
jgi:flagellar biosynthesis protein FliQ